MSAAVELRGVSKRFGSVAAVDNVSLTVQAGEFLTLLGPSGCGKTTLLRLVAGFEFPDTGSVFLDGRDVGSVPPHQRNVNQVFQSYALFPHLNVRENIAFGLRMQRLPAREIAQRVEAAIALVALGGCEDRRAHQLSGGQRQRVALARALAPRPAVLLLDEPLSALDARLRQSMQLELKRLQRQVNTTFIFVTHDQDEALTMSDRIALVHRGRVEQIGAPPELYHHPATAFAAEFIGHANLLEAERLGSDPLETTLRIDGGTMELRIPSARWSTGLTRAKLSIRPEKIHLSKTRQPGGNSFAARVVQEVFKGPTDWLVLETEGGRRLHALTANASALHEPIHAGENIWCTLHADDLVILP